MFGDFFRLIQQWIEFLWPFAMVREWETGGYYVCGRFWKTVGPGVYPVVPWFTDIVQFSKATAIVGTPRLDITLKDGTLLSFAASATVRMVDFNLAVNTVEDFRETTQELIAAALAEKLAEADPGRLDPESRGRLFAALRGAVQREAAEFGIEVSKLRFTTFVVNPRTYRLLTGGDAVASW